MYQDKYGRVIFPAIFSGSGRWKRKAPRGNSLPRGASLIIFRCLRFRFAFLSFSTITLVVVNILHFLWYGNILVIAWFALKYMIFCMFATFTTTISSFSKPAMFLTSLTIFFFKQNHFSTVTSHTYHSDSLCLFVRFPAMARHRDGEFLCAAFVLDRDCRLAILFWY